MKPLVVLLLCCVLVGGVSAQDDGRGVVHTSYRDDGALARSSCCRRCMRSTRRPDCPRQQVRAISASCSTRERGRCCTCATI
ncbi:MAG: hypothetical protein IPK17_19565 [Chloroflexi bacterium]|uniref:hypothetical protein n=1 Tax=Candidatus Flexifilum breve TaxID=3140694 RepID=UPI003136535E|nr:hypothetical protein [Chloroflexota bacterium]